MTNDNVAIEWPNRTWSWCEHPLYPNPVYAGSVGGKNHIQTVQFNVGPIVASSVFVLMSYWQTAVVYLSTNIISVTSAQKQTAEK